MLASEAAEWLHRLKSLLADAGHVCTAGQVEYAELDIGLGKWSPDVCRQYADAVLPKGRRDRVRLVLMQSRQAS